MRQTIIERLKEAALSIAPISVIVLLAHLTLTPMSAGMVGSFVVGSLMLMVGMAIFTMGADMAMTPMGEAIGAELSKTRKLWLIIISCFVLGVVVTVAEPDLQVLTKQVPAVPDMVLVGAVAIGVGVFLVFAILRILFQWRLRTLFLIAYGLVFAIAAFVPSAFLPVSFDAGGVTTGPITVPFILALGAGISAVRASDTAEEDSFGISALCSIGPVLVVLLLGLFYDATATDYAAEAVHTVSSLPELIRVFAIGIGDAFLEVLTVLLPITVIFLLLQVVRLRLARVRLRRILAGIVYTIVGLSLFLSGVNVGFMPAGTFLGQAMYALPYRWVIYPFSVLLGVVVVLAEPSVHVLNKQVEDITNGAISRRTMLIGLCAGVGIALLFSAVRSMTGLSIWWFILPGYSLALLLTFVTPRLFTAVAFDSGGVASGTMTVAFLLPFVTGLCEAAGGNILSDAFGVVALVAMMPLISMQVLGLVYRIKSSRKPDMAEADTLSGVEAFLFEDADLDGVPDDMMLEAATIAADDTVIAMDEPPALVAPDIDDTDAAGDAPQVLTPVVLDVEEGPEAIPTPENTPVDPEATAEEETDT